jgi:hypothetical protein
VLTRTSLVVKEAPEGEESPPLVLEVGSQFKFE